MADYDSTFFNYVTAGALSSAGRILPLLSSVVNVRSVLDVGCGEGAWLSVWKRLGAADVVGIDGDYVNRDQLLIPKSSFIPHDLERGFDLPQRFDLVQTLEVAEHLHPDNSSVFVESLVKHSDLILFSAAPKGQGGHNHINEREYAYWRSLFSDHGYLAVDYLRPLILHERSIEPWYRYNTILYGSRDRLEMLPEAVRRCCLAAHEKILDLSPPLYKIRKAVVSLLPVPTMTRLAEFKERLNWVLPQEKGLRP